MAIKELPKDRVSKYYKEQGLDVRPIKLTGFDWLRSQWSRRFGKFTSLDGFDNKSESVTLPEKSLSRPVR